MGIGGVTSANSMSGMQVITAASTDPKSKSIQNEITDVTQEMQKLSSKEDLSVNEKADERKKLQKEITSLNTELKQYQEELSKSQKREIMLAELQEDQGLTKEEKSDDKIQAKESSSDKSGEKSLTADKQQTGRQGTVITGNSDGIVLMKGEMNPDEKRGVDTEKTQDDETGKDSAEKATKSIDRDKAKDAGPSRKEMHAIVSADSSAQQAERQGSIIARTRDGIAILKAEINQDEKRGIDTEKKRDELKEMEKKEERAVAFQSSLLGEANHTMKSAAGTNAKEKDQTQVTAEGNAFTNALKASQEEGQAAQQRFHISLG